MKVLHVNSYYSGSVFYKNLYEQQITDGIDISVFVPVPSSYIQKNSDFGKYTTISPNHTKYDRLFFYLKQRKIYNDITTQYKIHEYSIVHAHSLFTNGYIAMKLKRNYGIPYIVAVRNTDVNIFFKYMLHLRRIGIQILENADSIIFLSEAYREEVFRKYISAKQKKELINKTFIVPNGIDDFWFKNLSRKKQIQKKNLRLLYVGAINKNKNIITTVKAIELLQQKGYHVEYSIVGKIEDKSVFNIIKDIPWINYISPMEKEELIKLYRNNDIFIMPSIFETFGLVYGEAMSQGMPVIYTRRQGFDRQFEDGEVGFSVEHYDYTEIAKKVEIIANNIELFSDNCIKNVEKFRWKHIVLEYFDLYKKILIKGSL